jgi:hypothetical protein
VRQRGQAVIAMLQQEPVCVDRAIVRERPQWPFGRDAESGTIERHVLSRRGTCRWTDPCAI